MDSRGWKHANSLGLFVEAEGLVSLNRVSASWDAARISRQFTRGERQNRPPEQDHSWAQDGLEIKGLALVTTKESREGNFGDFLGEAADLDLVWEVEKSLGFDDDDSREVQDFWGEFERGRL